MLPEWINKILEGMGLAGAIIFVLLMTVAGLVAYVKSMQGKADKVYGYRLAERDTLNKALTDAAQVLKDMLEATRDRNDLTEEQGELISKQIYAFELLKASVVGQYENIREHQMAAAQAVSAMADAIRQLSSMVADSRNNYGLMLGQIMNRLDGLENSVKSAVGAGAQSVMSDFRAQLGNDLTIIKRRRTITQTRPKG